MFRTLLISALLILCSYSLHSHAQPKGCPPTRRCPIISPPPPPSPLIRPIRPRRPLYPPTLHLMPRRPNNNPGPLSNRARILFITQELKRNITYDPQNYTGTWVGNNYCLFKGFYCDTVPDLNITGLARITFNGARFGGNFLYFYRFIMNLPDIAIFHANSNNFTGPINPNIKNLRYLYELDLSNNRFLGGFPSNVLGATNLTFVDLRFNTYNGRIPARVFNIDTDVLFINNNGFNQKIPVTLGNTPALYLTLANNKFIGELPSTIGQTWNTLLEVLFLNNKLNGCLPYEIGYLKKSTVFDVGGNLLTGPIPQSFGCLAKMELLSLANNQFYGTIPESLCKLPNAYNFSLSYNFFTQVGPWCRRLIRARRLDVRRNCITGLPQQKSPAECSRFFARPRSCSRESTFSIVPCRLGTTSLEEDQDEEMVLPTIDEMAPPSPRTYGVVHKPPRH
uniref:Leucine-rich repeat-containing N-terminal plant-type domain-containing protein n=1 Tax=Fagus sylvatica TaxID=28930 RepID=A0A2N9H588_FAGSY